MDLDRRLRCLSQNSSLNFEAMSSSSSSSSSQTMGGTTRSTPVSGSLPEDENDEKDEANGENGGAGGKVLAL